MKIHNESVVLGAQHGAENVMPPDMTRTVQLLGSARKIALCVCRPGTGGSGPAATEQGAAFSTAEHAAADQARLPCHA